MANRFFIFLLISFLLLGFDLPAQDTLVPYRVKDKWGYSNYRGKLVIQAQYESVEFFSQAQYETGDFFSNNFFENKYLAKVSKNKRVGLIDKKNKIIIPILYENIEMGYDHGEKVNCIIVKKKGKYGCINYQKKILLPIIYDSIILKEEYKTPTTYDQYLGFSFAVKQGDKYFVVKRTGKKVNLTKKEFEEIEQENWASGVLAPSEPNRIEEIRENSQIIIQKNSSIIDNISKTKGYGESEEYIAVYKDNKVGIVTQEELLKPKIENVLIPIIHDNVVTANNSSYKVYNFLMRKGGELMLYKNNGILIGTLPTSDYKELSNGYIITKENNKYGYLSFEEKILTIIPVKYDSIEYSWNHDLFLKVSLNGKNGYINKNGLEYFKD
jgi:hypothetical protein